jgi:hypothetical protein
MRIRTAKNDSASIPWSRDRKGNPVRREPVSSCGVCGRVIYDSVNTNKIVTCGKCVQILMGLDEEQKEKFKSKLKENLI